MSTELERLADEIGILFDDTSEVLLVDDDKDLTEVLGAFLDRRGMVVTAFGHPQAALDALPEIDPGVALLDLHMPGMDGLALAKAIHEVRPEIVPVMMTGDVRTETLIDAMRAGIHDYLVKPLDSMPLVAERVAHALELHNERRRAHQLAGFLHEANLGLRGAQVEIEQARTEIEMFNRILEERVETESRRHQAAREQLDAFRSAMSVLRAELVDLAGTVATLSDRMHGEGQTPRVDTELMGLLVDLRRVVKQVEALG